MRISRLFVETGLQAGGQISLDIEASHYVRTVLRLKKDAPLVLFNNTDDEFCARLLEVSRKQVIVEVLSSQQPAVESHLSISLGLAVSRSERMDWAIQKSVELGVFSITPLMTARCVVQLKGDKAEKKTKHWQKIANNAAEQSGRIRVPIIAPILSLESWVNQQQGLKIFLDPTAKNTLAQVKLDQQSLSLLSGPEGGFTEQERSIARAHGFHAIKLGPRILRTETAALAAIVAIQTLWGDFS